MPTIGILGAGQLGRMLALAGYPLGLTFRFYDPAPASPAGQLAPQTAAEYSDWDALQRFAETVDLITYEFENVPVEAAQFLAGLRPVFPPPQALETAQDRLAEKTLFKQLEILTPDFLPVDSPAELQAAAAKTGLPAVLKTRRLGYDGKGQAVVRKKDELLPAFDRLAPSQAAPAGLILESFVPFSRELSILAVRSRNGADVFYPLVENRHREGILRLSIAPAPALDPDLQIMAETYARKILDALDYVGVLALELFQMGNNLLANEIAPRVHNSGHWTQNCASPDQFAIHLMAGLGWPIHKPEINDCAAMVNLVGTLPRPEDILNVPGAHLHLYAKQPRPGRKLGHVNLAAGSEAELIARIKRLGAYISEPVLEQL